MRFLTEREILVILRQAEEEFALSLKKAKQERNFNEVKFNLFSQLALENLRKKVIKYLNLKYD